MNYLQQKVQQLAKNLIILCMFVFTQCKCLISLKQALH